MFQPSIQSLMHLHIDLPIFHIQNIHNIHLTNASFTKLTIHCWINPPYSPTQASSILDSFIQMLSLGVKHRLLTQRNNTLCSPAAKTGKLLQWRPEPWSSWGVKVLLRVLWHKVGAVDACRKFGRGCRVKIVSEAHANGREPC